MFEFAFVCCVPLTTTTCARECAAVWRPGVGLDPPLGQVGLGRPSAVCWCGQSSRGACRPANVSPIRSLLRCSFIPTEKVSVNSASRLSTFGD